MESYKQGVLELLSVIYGYAYGSTEFYIFFGATIGAAVFSGWILLSVFKSKRGLFSVLIVFALAAGLALASYVAVEQFALPHIEFDWAASYFPLGVASVQFLLVICLVGPHFFDLGPIVSLVITSAAMAAGVGAYYGTGVAVDIFDFGSEQIEKNEAQKLETIE